MNLDALTSPVGFLESILNDKLSHLRRYETWWEAVGKMISTTVDRAGTPPIQRHDRFGAHIDEISLSSDYWRMLHEGYKEGVVWRAFGDGGTLRAAFLPGYVTAYYDAGLYCPYTVSLATAVAVDKYAPPDVRDLFLQTLLVRDDAVWQGATWITEIGGGSDIGRSIKTKARSVDGRWYLTGEKYFCSNVGAELALVAARPENAPPGVRGIALFLVPRYRENGDLNYDLRRLKDKIATRSVPTGEIELWGSEAHLLGSAEHGIYYILEVLNLSRVANALASVALVQRALAEAYTFASRREVFGKKLIDQPLMRRQFERRADMLRQIFALTWTAVALADEVWRERAPQTSDRYQLFRLVTHLAKFWTAEQAVQTAKWAMEVNGAAGVMADYGVERWLREAMIVDIWEGPPHRQILDGLEAMERKNAHRLLFDYLAPSADPAALKAIRARVDAHLALESDEREATADDLFCELAQFTASACAGMLTTKPKEKTPATILS